MYNLIQKHMNRLHDIDGKEFLRLEYYCTCQHSAYPEQNKLNFSSKNINLYYLMFITFHHSPHSIQTILSFNRSTSD